MNWNSGQESILRALRNIKKTNTMYVLSCDVHRKAVHLVTMICKLYISCSFGNVYFSLGALGKCSIRIPDFQCSWNGASCRKYSTKYEILERYQVSNLRFFLVKSELFFSSLDSSWDLSWCSSKLLYPYNWLNRSELGWIML